MTDVRKEVAIAILQAILAEEGLDPEDAKAALADDGTVAYLDQGITDMLAVADAAIAAMERLNGQG